MISDKFNIQWIDRDMEPKFPPDPKFPDGMDMDTFKSYDGDKCRVELPYPAKRCGLYTIHCRVCNSTLGVTTAGRMDDPRSIVLRCNELKGGQG